MKLYFSARVLRHGRSGGIVHYALELIMALARQFPEDELHAGFSIYGLEELGGRLPASVHRHGLAGLGADIQAQSERTLLAELEPDWVVYFAADPQNFYGDGTQFRAACCIADLQHLHHPFFFPTEDRQARDAAFSQATGSAELVFTLSEFCRRDLCRTYALADDEVRVVPPAAPPRFVDGPADAAAIATAQRKHGLVGRAYAIYPSNFWPHKNHARLLQAGEQLQAHPPDGDGFRLVLPGNPAEAGEALRVPLRRAQQAGWLSALGYVSDEDLHALMSGARCVVFPSLFEGFGIPVAEALALGRPVACSRVTSLPEVGGELAHYFDPTSETEMATAIRAAWAQEVGAEFAARAQAQARRFSYEASAHELRAALNDRAASPARAARRPREACFVDEPPLVSVVTPSYQQAPFLRQCIESVLSQDYPRIEYRVLDGGSTDGSVEILRSYGDRFPWRSERDGGQTQAINAGLRLARGEILAYLNSDDFYLPGAISTVVEEWRRRPSVDIFYGRAWWGDEQGNFKSEYRTGPMDGNRLRMECHLCQPATFWRRRVLERFGPFDEACRMGMDYEYWQRVHRGEGMLCFLDQLLACSRDYAETKTRSQRGKVYREIFASQWRHWGRVDPNWWIGFLYYLADERGGVWRGLIPKEAQGRLSLARTLSRWTAKPGTWKRRSRLAPPAAHGGFFSDGWVGGEGWVELSLDVASRVRVAGVSPIENHLRVHVDGREAQAQVLAPGEPFSLAWDVPAGRHRVELRARTFQLSAEDPRQAAFFLLATNLPLG